MKLEAQSKDCRVGGVLHGLVKEGPLGIDFPTRGILSQKGTYLLAISGTGC